MNTYIYIFAIIGTITIYISVELYKKYTANKITPKLSQHIKQSPQFEPQTYDLKTTNTFSAQEIIALIKNKIPNQYTQHLTGLSSENIDTNGKSQKWFISIQINNTSGYIEINPNLNEVGDVTSLSALLSSNRSNNLQDPNSIPNQLIQKLKNDPKSLQYLEKNWTQKTTPPSLPESFVDSPQIVTQAITHGLNFDQQTHPVSISLKYKNNQWLWEINTDANDPLIVPAI